MSEEEVIKYLKNIKDKDLWIRGYVYGKKAIDTALQLLEQKDNKINKVIDKLKEVQEEFINYCPDCVDLANDILKILEDGSKWKTN